MVTGRKRICFLTALAGCLLYAAPGSGKSADEPVADPQVPAGVNLMRRYGWTPLHWAARHGQVQTMIRLLDGGAAVDARENMGRTPLHIAAMADRRDAVELLLARGADVNARDRWDVTPLRRMELLRKTRGWDRSDMKNLLVDSDGVR